MDTNLGQVELVKDINPDVSSAPDSLVEFNDKLYFSAYDKENGSELFVTDGTAEGTQLLVDLYPGGNQDGPYSSAPDQLVEFNDKLYFKANNGENANELFVSDGTAEGTGLFVDLFPGEDQYGSNNSSFPSELAEFQDKLYFRANNGVNGDELFVTDGTAEGTKLVADIYPGENQYGFSNGSAVSELVEFNDKLYFRADNGESGLELFVSDGTAEGTGLLVDLFPGEDQYDGFSNGSDPTNFVELNDQLYFTANTAETNNGLFVSDGTAEGTKLVADLSPETDENGNVISYDLSYMTEFNGKLYFSANDGENGNELFVSDGTAEGTQLFADIYPGENDLGYNNSSSPRDFVEFNDHLYFVANDGENGYELFVTDGTTEGTQLVADIYPGKDSYGYNYGSAPSGLTVVGNELFFSADNGETGTELFKLTLDDSVGETPILIHCSDGSENLFGGEEVSTTLDGINAEQVTSSASDFEMI
ncbi:MAG: hypothetical protein KME09_18640 [Pleurocapsa minor HA4230-MV1]|jgi:ELWxxDGT repeat protein|nr:hypothetical protein [Pleurocapsa minor HA4230-MV1]